MDISNWNTYDTTLKLVPPHYTPVLPKFRISFCGAFAICVLPIVTVEMSKRNQSKLWATWDSLFLYVGGRVMQLQHNLAVTIALMFCIANLPNILSVNLCIG